MAWGAARPQGFSVRIMTDHEDYPELAELYTHDRMSPLWFLNATQAGTAVITKASGADQELGTVEEALARVLELGRVLNWVFRFGTEFGSWVVGGYGADRCDAMAFVTTSGTAFAVCCRGRGPCRRDGGRQPLVR